MLANTHNNVTRLEIMMNKVVRMDVLQVTELDMEDINQSSMTLEVNLLTNWSTRSRTVFNVN